MIPDRDYLITKIEVERRHRLAAEERAARQARREAEADHYQQDERPEAARGAFGWLRRLAGARN